MTPSIPMGIFKFCSTKNLFKEIYHKNNDVADSRNVIIQFTTKLKI